MKIYLKDRLKSIQVFLENASAKLPIIGIGYVQFETSESTISTKNSLFVPELGGNLLPLTKLENNRARHYFEKGVRVLKFNGNIISRPDVLSHFMNSKI